MTIRYQDFFGGESGTLLIDGDKAPPGDVAPAGWANVSSPVKTGARAIRINVNGSQSSQAGIISYYDEPEVSCWMMQLHAWVVQSGVPALPYCLAGFVWSTRVGLEVGTDSKIRLVQMGASYTPAIAWADRVALTDWSIDALATDDVTFKEVSFWLDPKTLGMDHTWATLIIDDVVQWSADIGDTSGSASAAWIFYTCPAAANAAIYVTLDDCVGLASTLAADAPHLVKWPKPEVHAQAAIADVVGRDEWTGTPEATDQWKNWLTDDGDTSYNYPSVTSQKQASDGQTAATVGITGHTVLTELMSGIYGPILNFVHRDTGSGTKWNNAIYNSLGTAFPATIGRPGTTYIGSRSFFVRSSGSWAVADLADLNFGLTAGDTLDVPWRVTLCVMQWCTYINTFALLPIPGEPWPPVGGQRRQLGAFV